MSQPRKGDGTQRRKKVDGDGRKQKMMMVRQIVEM